MLFYRLLITLALLPLMLFTWRKGSLTPARFGFGSPASATLRIWLHAASNGELASARPLIDALLAHPHVTLVITVNSLSAKILGDDWHLPRTDICLAPFDLRWALRRFIRNWSVTSYVGLEAEFWPNRFSTLRASNSPNALVAARLSEKSVGLVTKLALNHIDWVAPQDARSRERFALLKLDEAKLAPIVDLKSLFVPNTHARSIDIAPLYDPAITIFAASVHSGEDIKVVEAFAVAKAARPDLHLIIAPRHPQKIDALLTSLGKNGLQYVQFSKVQTRTRDTDITVADTLGDMSLWYPLADLCFVGGSLLPIGGHTPFEPMQFETALIHGPHVTNFSDIYAQLDASGGAKLVANQDELAAYFCTYNPKDVSDMITAQRLVSGRQTDLKSLVQRITSHLPDA
jgi:3-deoxy-D-manno-octulosonic-acid transferase